MEREHFKKETSQLLPCYLATAIAPRVASDSCSVNEKPLDSLASMLDKTKQAGVYFTKCSFLTTELMRTFGEDYVTQNNRTK